MGKAKPNLSKFVGSSTTPKTKKQQTSLSNFFSKAPPKKEESSSLPEKRLAKEKTEQDSEKEHDIREGNSKKAKLNKENEAQKNISLKRKKDSVDKENDNSKENSPAADDDDNEDDVIKCRRKSSRTNTKKSYRITDSDDDDDVSDENGDDGNRDDNKIKTKPKKGNPQKDLEKKLVTDEREETDQATERAQDAKQKFGYIKTNKKENKGKNTNAKLEKAKAPKPRYQKGNFAMKSSGSFKNKLELYQSSSVTSSSNITFKNANLAKLTPLEKQFVEIKRKNPDTVLFVECGYKYKFFDEDAQIAGKELNIMCHMANNFYTASIPTQRLTVHVRRLVELNYKVGVVQQKETAALKARSDSKNKLFIRELTGLYTKGTLIGEDVNPLSKPIDNASGFEEGSFLMCLFEEEGKNNKVNFGMVAVQLHTGEIIYDHFEDVTTRNELQTRIAHLNPCEFLLPDNLSARTTNFLNTLARQKQIRTEVQPSKFFEYNTAFAKVSDFFTDEKNNSPLLEKVINMKGLVTSCFGGLIEHLQNFKLDKIFELSSANLKEFSGSESLFLNGSTVKNLELFSNQTDGRETGSLVWVLDRTKTNFGKRLFRKWIAKPLANIEKIQERLNSVNELRENSSLCSKINELLGQLTDIERGLIRIHFGKCSTSDFASILSSYHEIGKAFQNITVHEEDECLKSTLLEWIFKDNLDEVISVIETFFKSINVDAAKEGDKCNLFVGDAFPHLEVGKKKIEDCIDQIKELKKPIMKALKIQNFEYKSVSGQEYLIEVNNKQSAKVPRDWVKIAGTKVVSRYQTPELIDLVQELASYREELQIQANEAWVEFLTQFSLNYDLFYQLTLKVGTLDCLMSLVDISLQPDFVCPSFCKKNDETGEKSTKELPFFYAKSAKHPMVSLLIDDQYVPNDVSLDSSSGMIITGPNMGGKSCYMRMVALLVIMAQIGSYVPAESLELGVFDALFTRMGASDDIHRGMSTFMVELQETSEILHNATNKSLVLLDELGRGTSTHDGVAIAYATVHELIDKVKSIMMFATHYPSLTQFENVFPKQVLNSHMSYMQDSSTPTSNSEDMEQDAVNKEYKIDTITFLYKMVPTIATGSYGLNVAKLAAIPDSILHKAAEKSKELENIIKSRALSESANEALFKRLISATEGHNDEFKGKLKETIAQLSYLRS